MTPDPNLPRGVQAFLFKAADRRRRAEETIVGALRRASLPEVILPVLDYAGPYEAVAGTGDAAPYRFVDRRGELLALRADFTPVAARVLAPRLASLPSPVSFFYRGDVVRDEESGVGRLREFAQVGAERYGDPTEEADEAILLLLLESCAGFPARKLRLTLGWSGLLEKLLAAVAPSLAARDGRLEEVAVACRRRRVSSVEKTLLAAGVPATAAGEVAWSLLGGFDPASSLFAPPLLAGPAGALLRAVAAARRAVVGLEVVVDLAETPTAPYYTGLTFSLDATGSPVPVAAGGRYDGLLAHFGAPAPAVGFSVGIEAFAAATDAARGEEAPVRPLRIAVGKGRLLGRSLAVLRAGGADFPEPDGRRLVVPDLSGAFELLLLKDDDVPTYVAHGGADIGIVGSDRVAESAEAVFSPVDLPFGACHLSLIGRVGEEFRPDGRPVTAGTKFGRLARAYFDGRGIACEIVPLTGSVELAAALGLTDVVVDLVETGSTIVANGLAEIETILESRATLIVGRASLSTRRAEVVRLVEGVAEEAGK